MNLPSSLEQITNESPQKFGPVKVDQPTTTLSGAWKPLEEYFREDVNFGKGKLVTRGKDFKTSSEVTCHVINSYFDHVTTLIKLDEKLDLKKKSAILLNIKRSQDIILTSLSSVVTLYEMSEISPEKDCTKISNLLCGILREIMIPYKNGY